MIDKIARFFSALLSPLIIPMLGVALSIWLTWLYFLPVVSSIAVISMAFLFTFLVPLSYILLLMRLGKVSGFALKERRERLYPYIWVILSYIGYASYLASVNAPLWLTLFMFGAAFAAIVSCIINLWWKISIHTASFAGLLALLVRIHADSLNRCDMLVVISVAILMLGVLASSRLILKRHTLAQVFGGSLNGFLSVYIFTAFGN